MKLSKQRIHEQLEAMATFNRDPRTLPKAHAIADSLGHAEYSANTNAFACRFSVNSLSFYATPGGDLDLSIEQADPEWRTRHLPNATGCSVYTTANDDWAGPLYTLEGRVVGRADVRNDWWSSHNLFVDPHHGIALPMLSTMRVRFPMFGRGKPYPVDHKYLPATPALMDIAWADRKVGNHMRKRLNTILPILKAEFEINPQAFAALQSVWRQEANPIPAAKRELVRILKDTGDIMDEYANNGANWKSMVAMNYQARYGQITRPLSELIAYHSREEAPPQRTLYTTPEAAALARSNKPILGDYLP